MFSLSVIIPNYNNEKYIKQCIESVLSQTYPIKEIIIFDDCSTDNSKEILKHFQMLDDRIKVIFSSVNVGVSTARDTAIRATTSDYVCMLDADDYFYDKNKLINEMNVVENTFRATGKKVISFSQTIDTDDNGNPLHEPKHIKLSGNERFKIITRLYKNYMPRDFCFPKEAYIKSGGYTKELSLFEDWELNLKLLELTNFVYSSGFGTAYRHKPGGLSSVNHKKQYVVKKTIIAKFKISFIERILFEIVAILAYIKNRIYDNK